MTAHRPQLDDIRAAASRLNGQAVRTPLLESPLLNEQLGGRLLVKPECLQKTGSFKFRGAFNRISQLTGAELERGVIAFSSGNHAQGVAAAANLSGTPAVIVMPEDAPAIKIANTKAWGAEVVTYPRHGADREAIAAEIAGVRGLIIVPPYDDNDIIAGQGTVGLEITEQCSDLSITPDAVTICCGGGGLSSGSAIALSAAFPDCDLHTVEPEGWDDTARSLEQGERVTIVDATPSHCDALLARSPGEQTFAINSELITSGLVVSEAEVFHAMAVANTFLKLVAEPGGAVALAAALAGHAPIAGRTVVAVISGGNVDPALYAELLEKTA